MQQARHLEDHLGQALRTAALCSNDPICRAAHAGHEPRRALAARRRLPRLRARGRDLLRDAERLPRSRSGGAGARHAGRGVLSGAGVIESLLALPVHLRERLATALEAGLLSGSSPAVAVQAVLGSAASSDQAADALRAFDRLGVSGTAGAAWIRSLGSAESRTPRCDLVWSGPEVAGLHARDTRRVYEEVIGSAGRTLWVSTYAFFDGPRAFETLARRMDEVPALRATLLLNLQRRRGDTTSTDHLVRRFADRFWSAEWPGTSKPQVYFDPRALDADAPGRRPARQGRPRLRRDGVRDVGEPDRGGARPEHRDGAARAGSCARGLRVATLPGADRQGIVECVTGGVTSLPGSRARATNRSVQSLDRKGLD